MNFSTELTQNSIEFPFAVKTVIFHIPLTPFFHPPATSGQSKTRGFYGDDFFLQYKSTIEFDEDGFVADDPICGYLAYSLYTSVDFHDPPFWNGSIERTYVFDEVANTVRLSSLSTGTPNIGSTNTRTAATAYSGDRFSDPPDYVLRTYSEPVNQTVLEDFLDDWRSRGEAFRYATGSGLRTYAFIGQGATRSESDGYLADVGGGDVRALPYVFLSSAFGMTGDQAALWNGNFDASLTRATRKNFPIMRTEQSAGSGWSKDSTRNGAGLYRDGYSETELTEPLTSWRDDYGVFETGEELDHCPSISGGFFDDLVSFNQDGKRHELYLISINGDQYRITFETGYTDFEYDEEEDTYTVTFVVEGTHVLTTSVTTKRTDTTVFPHPSPGDFRVVRVAKIERNTAEGWLVISDIAAGDSPANQIGSHIRGGHLLLSVVKKRTGERWGFLPLTGGGSERYRVRSNRLHLTPGTITLSDGECGDTITGNYDAEWHEEYDPVTGLLMEREVTEWVAVVNGIDWTPEEAPTSISFSLSSVVTSTPTIVRREGTSSLTGRFIIAFDVPNRNGKIVSTDEITESVEFTGGINRTAEVPLLPPRSGHSVFFEGYRLTYY
jgi:hypothetical protein